ncbi:histidine-type phosphatase [Pseudomonas taetrolens]|uniref:histidine-type phosphatase n=1 Tax=Pseudomonas TaxID=286 RepID=UPI00103C7C41|nr:histidine-type phosphatase [Pseudomonas sp. D1HM]MBW0235132.1 phosphatase [Pseudomonas sp. D1HM]
MKRSVFLVPRLCASLILAGMFTPMTFAQTASNEAYVLDKVVQVSRHGVRPPTESNEKLLTAVTQRQWPTWLVPFGNLTGHGYTGAVEMGRYRGDVLRNAGLIPQGCPDAGQLLAHSSPMQRTKATAQALLDGMFPGCGFQPTYVRGSQDALFQANEMKFAALDPEKAKAGILKALGGSVEAAQARYKPYEDKLRAVACLPDADCPYGKQAWTLEENAKGRFSIKGLSAGANMGEVFRLEYSQGLPLDKVAFGHARSAAEVSSLMVLTKAKYDFVNDIPYIASRGASELMNQISLELKQGTPLASTRTENTPPDVPLMLLVAHDTNISYLRTMLGFNWKQGDYIDNNIPPVGTLQFERYKEVKTGEYFLRIGFEAQSMDQIRNLTTLSETAKPYRTDFASSKDCRTTRLGLLCPLKDAISTVDKNIDPTALTPYTFQ